MTSSQSTWFLKMKTACIRLIWKLLVPEWLLKRHSKNRLFGYIWKATHLQRFQSLSPQILKATDQFTPFKAKTILGVISIPRSPNILAIKHMHLFESQIPDLGFRLYISRSLIFWISVVRFHRSNSHCVNHWAHQTVWNQIMSVPALLTRSPKPAGTQQGQLAMLIPQQPAQTQTIISNRVPHRVCLHCTGQRCWCLCAFVHFGNVNKDHSK